VETTMLLQSCDKRKLLAVRGMWLLALIRTHVTAIFLVGAVSYGLSLWLSQATSAIRLHFSIARIKCSIPDMKTITFEKLFRVSGGNSELTQGQSDRPGASRRTSAIDVQSTNPVRLALVDSGEETCGLSEVLDAGTCLHETNMLSWHSRPAALLTTGPSQGTANRQCLPAFLIVGTQKAATGSLSAWLSSHPLVRQGHGKLTARHGHSKEGHFFDTIDYNPAERSPRDALAPTWRVYLRRFPPLSQVEVVSGVSNFEKTPSYSRFPRALVLAKYLVPSTHLILILREPIERAYSAFRHHARHGRFCSLRRAIRGSSNHMPAGTIRTFRIRKESRRWTDRCEVHIFSVNEAMACARIDDIDVVSCWPECAAYDFDRYVRNATVAGGMSIRHIQSSAHWTKMPHAAIDVVADGDYAPQVQRLFTLFPPQQVHVFLFEDVINDPIQTLTDLQEHLDLEHHDFVPQLHKDEGHFDLSPRSHLATTMGSLIGSLHRSESNVGSKASLLGCRKMRMLMLASTREVLWRFYAPRMDSLWNLLRSNGKSMIPPSSWPVCRAVNDSHWV